jgi:CelD/BcsL family acetyltransferase involved in cellulose biosynthesis
MKNVTITVVDSFEKWRALTPEWQTLLDRAESSSFFLTWEWLISWAEYFLDDSRTLFILTCSINKTLIGIAPFYLAEKKSGLFPLKELRFLGTPESGSDYLDVIMCKNHEREVAEALYAFLTTTSKRKWDQLFLTDIRADSLFLFHFMNCLEVAGKYVELTRSAICPVMRLPDSEDNLYAAMSSGWRKKFKQDMRVSERDYNVSHVVYQGHEVADHLDAFFQFYKERDERPGQWQHALLKQLISRYIDDPPLQLDLLVVDEMPRAALLHFKHRDTLSMYMMSVDKTFNPKISFGNILVGRSIINSLEGNYAVYDFLKGNEPYKFHWATGVHLTFQIRFWQKRPGALLSASSRMSRYMVKLLFR